MFFELPFTAQVVLFCSVFVLLFVASRQSIQSLYEVFHSLIQNDFIATGIIALIYFPGTVIHELSHFLMAILLLLPVHKLSLLPQRNGDSVRLGYVLYEKKDIFRGMIVGVAPVLVGILFLWWFYTIDFFSVEFGWAPLLKGYLIFILSSTMFSSKQDLVDIGYLMPILLLVGMIGYLFNIEFLFFLKNESFVEAMSNFMYSVTIYSSISLAIHIVIILMCKSIKRLLHIHSVF